MNLLELETLFRLLNTYGITQFSNGELNITIPAPKKSFADQIMSVSVEEIQAISEKSQEIALDKFIEKKKTQEEIDDEILFAHENF